MHLIRSIKRIRLYLMASIVMTVTYSCSKDSTMDALPDERLSAVLSQYQEQLASAPNGWKGHLFTSGGGGYGFWFEFDQNNRVRMLADISDVTGTTPRESSYRLKAALLPSLYFDTYSYIHELADPDVSVNGGTPGWGLFSDFEFSVLSASPDTIVLKGNLNDSKLQLVRASAEEAATYKEGNLNDLKTQFSNFMQAPLFTYLEDAAGDIYGLTLNMDNKILSFTYEEGGIAKTVNRGFAFSGTNEVVLSEVFRVGRMEVDRFRIGQVQGQPTVEAIYGDRISEIWPTDAPLFPFLSLWGQSYTQIRVNMEETTSGNGADFETRRLAFLETARPLLSAGTTFPEMRISLDKGQQLLFVNQIVRQGTRDFDANFVFSYTLDGELFTLQYEGAADANAQYIENVYIPVLEGFIQDNMQFGYDLGTTGLRAYGLSGGLAGFRFVGSIN